MDHLGCVTGRLQFATTQRQYQLHHLVEGAEAQLAGYCLVIATMAAVIITFVVEEFVQTIEVGQLRLLERLRKGAGTSQRVSASDACAVAGHHAGRKCGALSIFYNVIFFAGNFLTVETRKKL